MECDYLKRGFQSVYFWLIAYLTLRDEVRVLLPWCLLAAFMMAFFSMLQAIVRCSPQGETLSAQTIAQVRLPTAYADMHERGGVWTRSQYDAWLLAQTDAWLVVFNFSTREENYEQYPPTTSSQTD
jgi:hypothetical protein